VEIDPPSSLCQVGVARGDITPPVGIYHRMWGAATHDRSAGVHRPLTATVMCLRPAPERPRHDVPSPEPPSHEADADRELVLVAVDHCLLWSDDMKELLRRVAEGTGLPRERLLVMFSHTHGAGLMDRSRAQLPGGELIGPYLDLLADTLAQLVGQARQTAAPAVVSYASGRCSLAANRDLWDAANQRWVCGFNPDGPADDGLLVARITDFAGRVRGTVVNYACHPTTLAWDNRLISPDYVGAMREVVETATEAPCFFIQGASGELGPRRGFTGDVEIADSNGRQLGHAVLSALESLSPPGTRYRYAGPVVSGAVIGIWNDAPLAADELQSKGLWRYRRWTLDMQLRDGLPTVESLTAERAKQVQAETAARNTGDEELARQCRARIEVADRQMVRLRDITPGRPYPFPIHAWQIGDAIWVAVESEHYQRLQTDLRARFGHRPIIVATLVNGSLHTYLPPREVYGTGIYQETIALLAPGSLERLIDEIGRQIAAWTESGRRQSNSGI
jgi:hypothetical protein